MLKKIQASTNLNELETLLTKEKGTFGLELEKLYEDGRLEIEGQVKQGQFSSVVQKKDKYENMIGKMQGHHESMQRAIDDGQKKIERIMTIKQGQDAQ